MGRKRNQGKARRAAKAKAEQEAAEKENHHQRSLEDHLIAAHAGQSHGGNLLPTSGRDTTMQCNHGCELYGKKTRIGAFANAFRRAFHEASLKGALLVNCLFEAKNDTLDEFADVWNDSTKMEKAISAFLCMGTRFILIGKYDHAKATATFARYMEQLTAVYLQETQANICWPKVEETYRADMHTLVKFLRRRIPCSCLDEKYEEVKSITKIGLCYNSQCILPKKMTARSRTSYCSRCRCVTYCSRECQKEDWSTHKRECDECAATTARFEAKKKS